MNNLKMLKLEESSIDAKCHPFMQGMIESIMRRVNQKEHIMRITDDLGVVVEGKLRGVLQAEMSRTLSQYTTGDPYDVDGERDFDVQISVTPDGLQQVTVAPKEYLTSVIHAAGRTALKRSLLWHRDQLVNLAKEEVEACRNVPGASPYSLFVRHKQGHFSLKLPDHVKDGELLNLGPLSQYMLRALTHAEHRRHGVANGKAREETNNLLRKGFSVILTPTLFRAVYEALTGIGLLEFRVAEEHGSLFFSALLASGAYGAIVDPLPPTKPSDQYDYLPLNMADVPSCFGIQESEMLAEPKGQGSAVLFATSGELC